MNKRPSKSTGRSVKKERDPDDSSSRFWERLIVDWVAVAVLGFGLQGLWFGFTNFLVSLNPDMKTELVGLSAKLGWPWMIAVVAGLAWGVWRAWGVREESLRRR